MAYSLSLILMLFWGLMTSLKHFQDFNTNKVGFPDFSAWEKFGFLIDGYDHIFANYVLFVENFTLTGDSFKTSFYTMFSSEPVEHNPGDIGLLQVLLNTLIFCAGGALLPTFMCCFMGYVCAKYKYKFSTVIYSIVVFVMVMPIVGNAPAMLDFLRKFGLYDTYVGHAIRQCSFTSMYFLVFYETFKGIPMTYSEAAMIDGASDWYIMTKICLPLALNVFATVALITFIQFWNDYQMAMLYMPSFPTLSYFLFQVQHQTQEVFVKGLPFGMKSIRSEFVPIKMTATVVLMTPILIIFIALHERLMGNLSIGGIKG